MRLKKVTVTGTGTSAWLPVDREQAPFNIGIGCIIVSGTATYSVEHTFDEVWAGAPTVAFANSGLTAKTVSADGNYAFPVTAIRLNVTAGAAPVVSMTMIQGVKG